LRDIGRHKQHNAQPTQLGHTAELSHCLQGNVLCTEGHTLKRHGAACDFVHVQDIRHHTAHLTAGELHVLHLLSLFDTEAVIIRE
jgi:hypothetical protein